MNPGPQWVNSIVIAKALSLRDQGLLSPLLDRWITDLLELEPQENSQAARLHE